MRVEVVYALPERAEIVALTLPAGATVRDAIAAARLTGTAYGIFGRRVPLDTALTDGDRVEIYRPLVIGPKEARRRRAQEGKRRARRR